MVKEIKNLQEFAEAIGNNESGLVVIDFYGQWCPPCKLISPKFVKMSEKYPTVGFYKLDVDVPDVSSVVAACVITSLPTFCFFNKGISIDRMIGSNDVQLENMIKQNLPLPKKVENALSF
jgi:thioredoxin 1